VQALVAKADSKVKIQKTIYSRILGTASISSRDGLDFSLIKIESSEFEYLHLFYARALPSPKRIASQRSHRPLDTDVHILGGVGHRIHGRLSGTATFMILPGQAVSQKIWTLRSDISIEEGSSGSWVVDAVSGVLYGHIVAGCPNLGIAYIIPAHMVFAELNERFGSDWDICEPSAVYSSDSRGLVGSPESHTTKNRFLAIFQTMLVVVGTVNLYLLSMYGLPSDDDMVRLKSYSFCDTGSANRFTHQEPHTSWMVRYPHPVGLSYICGVIFCLSTADDWTGQRIVAATSVLALLLLDTLEMVFLSGGIVVRFVLLLYSLYLVVRIRPWLNYQPILRGISKMKRVLWEDRVSRATRALQPTQGNYSCLYCAASFAQQQNLEEHLLWKHLSPKHFSWEHFSRLTQGGVETHSTSNNTSSWGTYPNGLTIVGTFCVVVILGVTAKLFYSSLEWVLEGIFSLVYKVYKAYLLHILSCI
jgi:hypothetical protein